MALRHARDNRDFYGRRYSRGDFIWEVVSAEETEDYYEIKLSYRPAQAFRGQPGLEQFTIDKTGPIEFRQVIRQPIERPRWVLRASVAVVVALVVAGAVVAAIFSLDRQSGDSLTVPASAQGSQSDDSLSEPARAEWFFPITPNTRLEWAPLDGDVMIALEAGSVDRVLGFEFEKVSGLPQLPAGYVLSGDQFALLVQPDHDSFPIPYTFLKPVTITFRLTGSDVTLARGVESNVVIQRIHDGERGWQLLPTTVDFDASTAAVQVDNLSVFALTIKETIVSPTPTPTFTTIATLTPTAVLRPSVVITPTSTVRSPTPFSRASRGERL